MGAKLDRLRLELEKAYVKRDSLENKIQELERRLDEEEKTEIHDLVREANLTPEQLAQLIRMAAYTIPMSEAEEEKNEE